MAEAVSPYDDPAVSAGEIAEYLYCPKPQQSTNNMSEAQEQAQREYILEFLNSHGMPDQGTIHTFQQGDEANYTNEPIDEIFQPSSAVVMLIPEGGNFLDGQCYDKWGYKVYAD